MNIIKKIWHDPVWSKVISVGIIALIGYFSGIFYWISSFFTLIYSWLINSVQIPYWLFFILILFPLYAIVKFIKNLFKESDVSDNDFRNYHQDILFDIKWRWSFSSDGSIYNVNSFCPKCDLQLYPTRISSFHMIDDIGFKCDDCNKILVTFEHDYETLEDKVIRTIQKNIRNGNWKRRIEDMIKIQSSP